MRPPDVRIRRGDGTIINCEIVGVGTEPDGTYVWEAAGVIFNPATDELQMEELPAGTAMRFRVPEEYSDT